MNASDGYKDRALHLKLIGAVLMLGGVAVGLLAPLEIYCFSFFSEGGRFAYPGFGFGSFMFGNIASQIVGYYLIAAVLIPLGYGHLKLRKWIAKGMLALAWFWLIFGLPLSPIAFFILLGSKELHPLMAVLAGLITILGYFLVPFLLIRFYHGKNVSGTLAQWDAQEKPVHPVPLINIITASSFGFIVIVLNLLILFNAIFPVFGFFVYGLAGTALLTPCMGIYALLAWGSFNQMTWAWWVGLIFHGLFTLSVVISLLSTPYPQLLAGFDFPPFELDILDGIPLKGWHLSLISGLAMLAIWVVHLRSYQSPHPSGSKSKLISIAHTQSSRSESKP